MTRLPETDVVVVGLGWTGAIVVKELLAAGLRVVGLERGPDRPTSNDPRGMHDELKYGQRMALMQDIAKETVSVRNSRAQSALPMRRWGAFTPGTGVGGSGLHWGGQTARLLPYDFRIRSHLQERYGKGFIDAALAVQDWGVTYEDLEPHYDFFERVCGVAGKAGNLRGTLQPGGNPFEGPRSAEYPNPPMLKHPATVLYEKTVTGMGLHPFSCPSSNVTRSYVNPYGARLHPCVYCGFCARFDCNFFAKATPPLCILDTIPASAPFELRANCQVTRVNLHADRRSARSVTYRDAAGREVEQPAKLVVLCAYSLNNVRLMLLSGIGKPYDPATRTGVVGRNYAYQTNTLVPVLFGAETRFNSFMSASGAGVFVDDYNGDNFDHADKGFAGGGMIGLLGPRGLPIGSAAGPSGTPRWGSAWKRNVQHYYTRSVAIAGVGCSTPTPDNYLDLDPTYTDSLGQPLLRMTYDFPANDRRMAAFLTDRSVDIAQRLGAERVIRTSLAPHFSVEPYQGTHNTGGAVMGAEPGTSAVNRYLQSWDQHNVFVMGGSAMAHNGGYGPTGTIGALTYWSVRHIVQDYLGKPAPLVAR